MKKMILSTIMGFIPKNSLLQSCNLQCRQFGPLATTRAFSSVSSDTEDEKVVQDMLYRIRCINSIPDDINENLFDFQVDGIRLGKVIPQMADMLCSVETDQKVFEIKYSDCGRQYLTLAEEAGTTHRSRTKAVAKVMEKLRDDNIITGWRDEAYPVSDNFYNPPLFNMERVAVPYLGVMEYGVHINGLVGARPGEIGEPVRMWIARRSRTKSKFPGMLDHIVAGGQPAGLGLMDNVIKECHEEAGIPENLTRAGIQATGAISYETFDKHSGKISRVVLFNYDLYLPNDFVPKPVDGEVEEFFLWDMEQIRKSMDPEYPDPIKPNCYVVIIDYMLRLGFISPECPGYLDILKELRSGDCC